MVLRMKCRDLHLREEMNGLRDIEKKESGGFDILDVKDKGSEDFLKL